MTERPALMWQIQQDNVRTLLEAFQHDFAAIRRNIEVTHIENGEDARYLAFGAGLQVRDPNVLMLGSSAQKRQLPSLRQGFQIMGATRQRAEARAAHPPAWTRHLDLIISDQSHEALVSAPFSP